MSRRSPNEAGAKQIDELQDLVRALSDQVIELGGKPATEITYIEAATALLEAAEARVKELEARRIRDANRIYELENDLRNSSPNTDIGMF